MPSGTAWTVCRSMGRHRAERGKQRLRQPMGRTWISIPGPTMRHNTTNCRSRWSRPNVRRTLRLTRRPRLIHHFKSDRWPLGCIGLLSGALWCGTKNGGKKGCASIAKSHRQPSVALSARRFSTSESTRCGHTDELRASVLVAVATSAFAHGSRTSQSDHQRTRLQRRSRLRFRVSTPAATSDTGS